MRWRENGWIFARNSREILSAPASCKLCLGKISDSKLTYANRQNHREDRSEAPPPDKLALAVATADVIPRSHHSERSKISKQNSAWK
jgi:hypothetical protein